MFPSYYFELLRLNQVDLGLFYIELKMLEMGDRNSVSRSEKLFRERYSAKKFLKTQTKCEIEEDE